MHAPSQTQSDTVAIALICDEKFVLPTAVAIQSLIGSKLPQSAYKVYVVASGVTEEQVQLLESLGQPGCEVRCVLASSESFDEFRHTEQQTQSLVSITALLKFELANLLHEKKVLYLDGDICVRGDLSELYGTNIENHYVAAVWDSSNMYANREPIYCLDDYFNSGIMLLNLRELRANNIPSKLIAQKRALADVTLMDQNVFNLVMTGHVCLLPIRYNYMCLNLSRSQGRWSMDVLNERYGTSYQSLDSIGDDAVIVHFASRDKPWKIPVGRHQEEWLAHLTRVATEHPCHLTTDFFMEVNDLRVAHLKQDLQNALDEVRRVTDDARGTAWANEYITARVDMRVAQSTADDFQIVGVSDPNASISSPGWFTKEGHGYIVQSKSGSFSVSLRCPKSSQLVLALRGIDARNESGTRVPRWVTFTSLIINGVQLLDEPVAVWHDKTHAVTCSAPNDDVQIIKVSWIPGVVA